MKLIESQKSEKKHHLDRLLELGIVMIFVDTRREGVMVPKQYYGNPQLPLNISYTFQIPDFSVLDDHVEVSLTFSDGKFFCKIPFDAIYVLTSQIVEESIVFPEDFPPEFMPQVAVDSYEGPEKCPKGQKKKKKPALSMISSDQPDKKGKRKKADKGKSEKKSHLKLVKNHEK